jgi:hypothetical protein
VIFGKKAGHSQRSKPKEPEIDDPGPKRGKEMKSVPVKAGSTKSLGRGASFRMPDDVFGSTPLVASTLSAKGKGKGKIEGLSNEQFETLNKAVSVTAPRGRLLFQRYANAVLVSIVAVLGYVGGEKICSEVLVEIWDHKRGC